MPVRAARKTEAGFTVMEMMLAVMAFCIIIAIVLLAAAQQQATRRDVARLAGVSQLQKALALFAADSQNYPSGQGCLTGTDRVSMQLVIRKLVEPGGKLVDPKFPDDPAGCLWYKSDGSTYSLRYVLETDLIEAKGEHVVVP